MSFRIKVAPEAMPLLEQANAWWNEHRPAARSRVANELFRIVSFLTDSPKSGRLHEKRGSNEVRCLRLRETPYYLYYIVDDDEREVLIVSLWSAMRGSGPPL